tara:strand:+ start:960 stop:1757 length:798 start_codon:yes stop_codon:yes gene_type:complete
MAKKSLITLTSDFGYSDPFVGIMQGVMLGINPSLRFIHLTHDIEAHNILQAVYVFETAYSYFPAGTIHLIVVDPGVGSKRKFLLVKSEKYCFIAPDNGVLSAVFQKEKGLEIYQIDPEKFVSGKISSTFHGRDIFAPAAGLFSLSHDPAKLAHRVENCKKIDLPLPKKIDTHSFSGEVIHIDRFGNLITNFSERFISQNINQKPIKIKIGHCLITSLKSYYSEANPQEVSALINSWNNIEIFLLSANVADFLKVRVGDGVEIETG